MFIRAVFYYFLSCGHSGICNSHVEIKSGKNCKTKYKHAHYRKLYPTLPGWPTQVCSYEKYSSHLGGILEKNQFRSPKTGLLTSHMNTCFYRSFLNRLRSDIGGSAHQTGPAHLHKVGQSSS